MQITPSRDKRFISFVCLTFFSHSHNKRRRLPPGRYNIVRAWRHWNATELPNKNHKETRGEKTSKRNHKLPANRDEQEKSIRAVTKLRRCNRSSLIVQTCCIANVITNTASRLKTKEKHTEVRPPKSEYSMAEMTWS